MSASMNAAIETTVCPIDAYDNVTQAREILNWVEAISWATSAALAKGDATKAKHLAAMGQYLASDWANHFDYQAEQLAKTTGVAK